jgi:hypothetical protein
MAKNITEIFAGKQFAEPETRVTSLKLSIALKDAGVDIKSKYICYNIEHIKHEVSLAERTAITCKEELRVSRYTSDELRQILQWIYESVENKSVIENFVNHAFTDIFCKSIQSKLFIDEYEDLAKFTSETDALATFLLALLKELKSETE